MAIPLPFGDVYRERHAMQQYRSMGQNNLSALSGFSGILGEKLKIPLPPELLIYSETTNKSPREILQSETDKWLNGVKI